jgi:hypothetical protein
MTTAQESTNGHRVFPPPCSLPLPQEENQSKDSPNNNESPTPVPANAYHVPPARYAPKTSSYCYDDTLDLPPETTPLPERCQFMFSDGRQCTMARSDIHPSLCPYHSEREDQLFGAPSSRGSVVGAGFDLPELYSACRDLTTAAGVNRALGQVFRLLAQRRIFRQEAATFAKLAHLLLQSIRAASQEQPMTEVVERWIRPELSPVNNVQRDRSAQTVSAPASSLVPLPAPAASPAPLSPPAAIGNSSEMNTSATAGRNSREINTSENIGFEPIQNQHLQNNGSRLCSSGRPDAFGRET